MTQITRATAIFALGLCLHPFSSYAVNPLTVISGNFDPDTSNLNSMNTQGGVRLVGGFDIAIPVGAYEDSSFDPGVPGSNPGSGRISFAKPFWTHAAFFSPDENAELGRVVLPINVAGNYGADRGLRLEIWRVDGDRDDPENDWVLLSSSTEATSLAAGRQFINFDFLNGGTPLTMEAGQDYAFNLAPIAVGSSGASQAYFWLVNYGVPTVGAQILWNYNYNALLNSDTSDAAGYPFVRDGISNYGLLELNEPGMLIQDYSVVPEPAATPLLISLAAIGLAFARRRKRSIKSRGQLSVCSVE